MKLEPEVRMRYARWARELAEALETGREDSAAQLLMRFNGPGAWALREGVEHYLRRAIEALGAFSLSLLALQSKHGAATPPQAEGLDGLTLLAEGSVHRALDALERALGELDLLGEAWAASPEVAQAGIARIRLALQDVLATQRIHDELGQAVGRCANLAEALTLQLDELFHRVDHPLPPLWGVRAEGLVGGPREVTQEQIDRLLQQRGNHG